jgi:alanyl-tRNA synthetase
MLSAKEIQSRFLAFFEKRGHAIIPSASLIPENDPSVLFNTAGMQPLVPYLLGENHPMGNRLANIQKCVRTGDLDEVGDNTHFTLFFMMGNWSLGDYFKQDAIKWSHEFLTNKEIGLGLDVKRLYVTVFEGNDDAPLDNESKEIWMSLGIPENRIYTLGAKDNWWSPGDNGPCGPDTEMFYDLTEDGIGDISKEEFISHCDKQNIVEIWNDVFMEYEKKDGKVVGKLSSKNVDTGSGLERITAVVQGVKTGYDTDLFTEIFNTIKKHKTKDDTKSERIIADHIRASVFMIADGVLPANSDRGYIVRRLLRRATNYANNIGSAHVLITDTAKTVCEIYKDWLITSPVKEQDILNTIEDEVLKFEQTLEKGMKEFLRGEDPFVLFTSYGFPIELTIELAQESGQKIDIEAFNAKMKAHQELSRSGSEQKFKGGLANHNEQTIKLHTAHHLLLAALQEIVSPEIKQRGSNITEERLRMDFNFERKLTPVEIKAVEDKVNEEIQKNLTVVKREMPLTEATAIGAQMEFGAKYPETVSIYFIEDQNGHAFSKEFCGGPHVENTKTLGIFKIQKEESVAAGIRRIKAVLL